jgi:hypothetical protein
LLFSEGTNTTHAVLIAMEEPMSDQHFGKDSPTASTRKNTKSDRPRDAASQAFSQASDMARDAGEKAKRAAGDTASTVTDNVKELLDRQLATGATMVGQFASSIRLAADDLGREAPMLGGLIRGFANSVDGYADGLQDKTVEQLARSASDFTRRQPALVFGLAALAGFLALRTFKSTGSSAAPPIQPSQYDYYTARDNG